MASSVGTGLTRLGILLSVVWIIIVAGIAAHESKDVQEHCLITPKAESCRHFFFKWQWVDPDPELQAKQAEEKKKHPLLGQIILDVTGGKKPVYRLDPQALVGGVFIPLAVLWGLGLGIGWCVAGFRRK